MADFIPRLLVADIVPMTLLGLFKKLEPLLTQFDNDRRHHFGFADFCRPHQVFRHPRLDVVAKGNVTGQIPVLLPPAAAHVPTGRLVRPIEGRTGRLIPVHRGGGRRRAVGAGAVGAVGEGGIHPIVMVRRSLHTVRPQKHVA
jgi:hypothetical protein